MATRGGPTSVGPVLFRARGARLKA